jgi:hypothetical protein
MQNKRVSAPPSISSRSATSYGLGSTSRTDAVGA